MKSRFQFGLSTLLTVVTACALFCPFGVRVLSRWELERHRALTGEIGNVDNPYVRWWREPYTAAGLHTPRGASCPLPR